MSSTRVARHAKRWAVVATIAAVVAADSKLFEEFDSAHGPTLQFDVYLTDGVVTDVVFGELSPPGKWIFARATYDKTMLYEGWGPKVRQITRHRWWVEKGGAEASVTPEQRAEIDRRATLLLLTPEIARLSFRENLGRAIDEGGFSEHKILWGGIVRSMFLAGILVIAVVLTVIEMRQLRRLFRIGVWRAAKGGRHRCHACGYDRSGVSMDRCPECAESVLLWTWPARSDDHARAYWDGWRHLPTPHRRRIDAGLAAWCWLSAMMHAMLIGAGAMLCMFLAPIVGDAVHTRGPGAFIGGFVVAAVYATVLAAPAGFGVLLLGAIGGTALKALFRVSWRWTVATVLRASVILAPVGILTIIAAPIVSMVLAEHAALGGYAAARVGERALHHASLWVLGIGLLFWMLTVAAMMLRVRRYVTAPARIGPAIETGTPFITDGVRGA